MSRKGMGVILGSLTGNKDTVDTIKNAIGKTIEKVWLNDEDNSLNFKFTDNTGMYLYDAGQTCCEQRYMVTADNLSEYKGAKLLGMEVKDVSMEYDGEWGDTHEIQFLDVKTDKGVFQMASHNEHNGYYGGFHLIACENNG